MEEDIITRIKIFSFPLSCTNIQIMKYFNCESRFNDVFSKDNLPRIKDGAYAINLDDNKIKEHIEFHYLFMEIL